MMIQNVRTKIHLSKTPVDMRASYDTLFAKTKEVLGQDPFSGHLFVFMNQRRNAIKCLYYDGTGLVLICKRLERGNLFSKLNPFYEKDIVLTQGEFNLFFEGADLRKRFIESPNPVKKGA